jgi:hypothetical protein
MKFKNLVWVGLPLGLVIKVWAGGGELFSFTILNLACGK